MRFIQGEVLENRPLSRDFFLLKVGGKFPEAVPGQFAMLFPSPSLEPFLGRPFGIAMQEEDSLLFLIKVVGRGTFLLSRKKEGESLAVIAPLGKGFSYHMGRTLLVGGGSGVAPLIFLASRLSGYTLLYGARTKEEVFLEAFPHLKGRAEEVVVVTEDGSAGRRGLLTQHIPAGDFSMAYVSGPWAMMREFSRLYKGEAQFSLETRMACGFGVCYGCAVRIKRGGEEKMVRACVEGPVFKGEEIIWIQG